MADDKASVVISFEHEKEKRQPHFNGKARCLSCKHEWMAVAESGSAWLECPKCTRHMGRFIFKFLRAEKHWHCGCENDLFYATPSGLYCPNCGEWQHGL